jgi:hypothetical protein
MQDESGFSSAIPTEFLDDVLDVGAEIGIDPTSSDESERYSQALITEFERLGRPKVEFRDWLRQRFWNDFQCAAPQRPEWIQSPEWPIVNGKPLVFVGQVELPASAGLFHDDAVFYVFMDSEKGVAKVVIQVA